VFWVCNNLAKQAEASIYRSSKRWLRIWEESGAYLPGEAITEARSGAHAFTVWQSLSRGCHNHENAVNQATTCPLLRSRRAPTAIFHRPRGQVGTKVTQLWPSPPHPKSFTRHGYPLHTGTNRGTAWIAAWRSPTARFTESSIWFSHYTIALFISCSDRTNWSALFFNFCVATNSPTCIKVVVQCTSYNFVTKTLLKHPLNPPQFDLKVHSISLMVKVQS
jgi:hypothetical protein